MATGAQRAGYGSGEWPRSGCRGHSDSAVTVRSVDCAACTVYLRNLLSLDVTHDEFTISYKCIGMCVCVRARARVCASVSQFVQLIRLTYLYFDKTV